MNAVREDRLRHVILHEVVGDKEAEPGGVGGGVLGVAVVGVKPCRPRRRVHLLGVERGVVVEGGVAHGVAVLIDRRDAERRRLDHAGDVVAGEEALVHGRRVLADERADRLLVIELGAPHEDAGRHGETRRERTAKAALFPPC